MLDFFIIKFMVSTHWTYSEFLLKLCSSWWVDMVIPSTVFTFKCCQLSLVVVLYFKGLFTYFIRVFGQPLFLNRKSRKTTWINPSLIFFIQHLGKKLNYKNTQNMNFAFKINLFKFLNYVVIKLQLNFTYKNLDTV